MALVVNIRTVDFNQETGETAVLGNCSSCDNQLVQQPVYGFPAVCPYCHNKLENGHDTRDWIWKAYPKQGKGSILADE